MFIWQFLCISLLENLFYHTHITHRMEPLLSAQYSTIAPCMIHSYNATDKIRYSEMPLEPIIIPKEVLSKTNSGSVGGCGTTGNGSGVKSDPEESENSTPCSSIPSTPSKASISQLKEGVTSPWSWWLLMKGSNKKTSDPSQDMSQTSQDMQGIIPERIDFVLREGSMESSYISALTSHTSYWNNLDVAHFMLNVLYPDAQPTQLKTAELTKT
ncbi:unnamed protein product [Meganyctiphanes norvegica]|uniref:DDHD domain-containing protein n=1 Tax=Meganyctiphanes norvegica TaxID=48144 RepID=A0AAV2Q625_MEGNR